MKANINCMKVLLEEWGGHLGIEIPRQAIPAAAMALASPEGKLDISLMLDAKTPRVTKVRKVICTGHSFWIRTVNGIIPLAF